MASRSPDSPSSESSRATSSSRENEKEDYERGSEVGPMMVSDMYQHGVELYKEKRYEDAVRVLTEVVTEEEGRNFQTYHARAQCHMELHNYSKAISDLRRATEMHPEATEDQQRAVAHFYAHIFSLIISSSPAESSLPPLGLEALPMATWKFYNRALSSYYLSEYENAIMDFTRALEVSPSFAAGYRCRGTAYLHLGRCEKAIEDLKQSSELEKSATTYYNLGLAYGNLHQFESAVKYFTQAIALNPNDAATYSNRGISYKALRQFENAIADFSTALTLNDVSASSYDHRAQCHAELGAHALALADYDKSLVLAKPTPARYHRRSSAHFALNNIECAINDVDAAITLAAMPLKRHTPLSLAPLASLPHSSLSLFSHSHQLLGSYYFTRAKYLLDSNLAQAVEDLGKSLSFSPLSIDALYLRSSARYLLNDSKGSMEDIRRASKLDGSHALASHLAISLFPL